MSDELVDEIRTALHALEDGEESTNLTCRDSHIAALFRGLEETEELSDVIDSAAEDLDWDPEGSVSKSTAMALLIRVGLEEVAPETLEAGRDAYREFLLDQAGEF